MVNHFKQPLSQLSSILGLCALGSIICYVVFKFFRSHLAKRQRLRKLGGPPPEVPSWAPLGSPTMNVPCFCIQL